MSEGEKKPDELFTECQNCGGPFDGVGVEQIELHGANAPNPILLKLRDRKTKRVPKRCDRCLPDAKTVVQGFRKLIDDAFHGFSWEWAEVRMEDGTCLGRVERFELFDNN